MNESNDTVKSVKEIKEKQLEFSKRQELFAKTKDSIKLLDLSKSQSRTFTVFSKDKLRTYLKNPLSNEANIRALSQFLYRLSNQYRRIVNYYAEMIDLTAFHCIPQYSMTDDVDKKKIVEQYEKTLKQVKKMNLKFEIMKILITCWREDTFYGYVYEDDNSFYIMPLDGSYCKISSVNLDGTLNFAFDFNYLRANSHLLEFWDKDFSTMYRKYESDSSLRWQELNPERTVCFKVNIDDITLNLPPFVSLFEQIIDLIDLQALQTVKDELSIYKLLVARLETIKGSDDPDDFAVDVDTAIEYYNMMSESLPDSVNAILSPLPIDTIQFEKKDTDDVNMLSKSMSNLFKSSGSAQILDSDKISGSTAFEASILCDSVMATKILLPQIEAWVNRYLRVNLGDDHATIKYIEVTPYTKASKIREVKEAAQYGLPVKLMYTTLLGLDPLDSSSLNYIEQELFDIHNSWIPLNSTHVQSGEVGAPTKESDELSDEGDASRDKADKSKG